MQRHREWGPWYEYCLHFQGRIRPRRPRELTGKRKTEQILRRKGDLHAAYLNAGEKVYRQRYIDARHCSFSKCAKSLSTGCKGHFYQTLECANGKRMLFMLDTGSVESIIASADLRKFCPESIAKQTKATTDHLPRSRLLYFSYSTTHETGFRVTWSSLRVKKISSWNCKIQSCKRLSADTLELSADRI